MLMCRPVHHSGGYGATNKGGGGGEKTYPECWMEVSPSCAAQLPHLYLASRAVVSSRRPFRRLPVVALTPSPPSRLGSLLVACALMPQTVMTLKCQLARASRRAAYPARACLCFRKRATGVRSGVPPSTLLSVPSHYFHPQTPWAITIQCRKLTSCWSK